MPAGATEIAGTRRTNLAGILQRLHVEGPSSRADLTAATGLNRSTVADLVGELVDAGLATERAPDPAGRAGRPSPVVSAADDVVVIAANPEVDAIDVAAIALSRRVVVRERIDVDHTNTPAEAVARIGDCARRWRTGRLAGARVVGAGIAVPGLVRASDGVVRDAPHLGWRDQPLGVLVSDELGVPAVVANDASAGATAEHLFGAGRGVADLVYLNGGASGIGGGLVIGGRTITGAGGYAGEFGQNRPGILDDADRRAPDGVLEDEVSRVRLLAAAGIHGGDDGTLAEALRRAGAPAVAELDRQRRILATALANAVNVLNPAVVILGGFLAVVADDAMDALTDAVRAQAMPANAEGVGIRSAALAEDRLLIGAAEAAWSSLLRDPPALGRQR